MFDGLDDIDWEALGTPEIPGLLRAIERDGEDAEDAGIDLYHPLCEHRSPSAVTSILPFLVEAVSDTRLSTRADLSDTLRDITALQGLPARWTRAWTKVAPGLLRLLDDADREVRGNVLAALAASPDEEGRVSDELRSRWEATADDDEDDGGDDDGDDGGGGPSKVDLAMSIIELDEPGPDDTVRRWLTGLLDSPDAERRVSAAAAVLATEPDDARAQEEMAEAVRRGDVLPWERREWMDWRSASVTDWARGRKNGKAERTRLALGRLEATDSEERARAANDAAFLLATWPSTEGELLPALARHADDDNGEVRAYAVHVLAACGSRSVQCVDRFADRVAELTADATAASPYTDVSIGDLAVWALSRAGDRRCVPHLRSWLDGSGRTGFDEFGGAGGHPQSYLLDTPFLHDVLETARPYADELLPAVRARLRSSSDYGWCREMAQILESWGEDAAPAVPELIELLRTDAGQWASRALAEMGPVAAEAAPALRRAFESKRRRGGLARLTGPFRRAHLALPSASSKPRFDQEAALVAAGAYWRVTGDDEAPARPLSRALDDGNELVALQVMGDIGSPAPGCADRVRDFVQDDHEHKRIYAARAYSRMTGDTEVALRVFTESLRPIAGAELVEPVKWLAEFIAEMGPPAAGTVPLMRAALELDLRLNSFGGWLAIDRDQRDRGRLAHAIEAVST